MADGIQDFEQAIPIFRKLVEEEGRRELADALATVVRNYNTATEHLKGKTMHHRPPNYDPLAVQPIRNELTRVGVRELLTPEDVDALLGRRQGTVLLVVNSVCGCAAGSARPGVMLALQHSVIPDELTTVFAGMEHEAVERARSYLSGYPPSSPSVALFKNGEVAAILERHDIERGSPEEIARTLTSAFDRFCSRPGPSVPREEFEKIVSHDAVCGSQIPSFGGSLSGGEGS